MILAGFTYGITDDIQASITGLLPIFSEIPFFVAGSAKMRILAMDKLIFSLQPSVTVGYKDDVTAGTIGIGFLLDIILDQEGKAVVSINESNYWAWGGTSDDDSMKFFDGMLFQLGVGINYRVHNYVKLLFEIVLSGGIINGTFDLAEEATMINYGVRFCSRAISVDLTMVRPIHPDVSDELIMGIPFVAFSARF